MKDKDRVEILVRLINKSDEILDDILKMTIQIYEQVPGYFIGMKEEGPDRKIIKKTANL